MLTNQELLKPELLQTVEGLELIAKEILSAYRSGPHPGKLKGAGAEFSQYRSYQWGDDLRQMDWKLYARSDRFYIREAETDSQVTVHFIIDLSLSMSHESRGLSKLNYSRGLTAALAYLALGQGDRILFSALNSQENILKPPLEGRGRLSEFLYELSEIKCEGKWPEEMGEFLADKETANSKQMIVFLSDLYEEKAEISKFLKNAQASAHEVIVFHLMGGNELTFDFPSNPEFVDLETGEKIQLDTSSYKAVYIEKMKKELGLLQDQMANLGVHYQLVNMDQPISDCLEGFIQSRNY
ncbi:DUF58 domain-containing protein [Xanthovirga aplysinae]|uniref:DUF58 domain-containing protein n=1 Tax=Xanthovirga aplysinae TaxID=2529853 RepID=UPI0016574E31|nr:DUF58 domain-containing protein [Xanthovirga aplysinae]